MILLREVNVFTSRAEDKIYEPLLVFGEEKEFLPPEEVNENKECYVTKMVGILNDIHDSIKNLNILLKNLLNQLHNLYNRNLKEFKDVFQKVFLVSAFDCLGSILVPYIEK
jgi:hypothetical protein